MVTQGRQKPRFGQAADELPHGPEPNLWVGRPQVQCRSDEGMGEDHAGLRRDFLLPDKK
jgi:hypothetical protein